MSYDIGILIRQYRTKLKMSAKRNVIIVVCIFSVCLGVYFMYFNHADAVDILAANKQMMNAKKHFEYNERLNAGGAAQRHVAAAAIIITEYEQSDDGNETSKSAGSGSAEAKSNASDAKTHDSNEHGKVVVEVNEVDIIQEQKIDNNAVESNERDPQDFDWDRWVYDNDYVSIGDIYTKCEQPGRKLVGKTLLMEDKAQGGVKAVILFNMTWPHEIEYGTIHMTVMYDNMELYGNTFDLCTVEPDLFECPLPAGPMSYNYEVHVPAYVPKGTFYSKAWLIDQDENEVACGISEFNNL